MTDLVDLVGAYKREVAVPGAFTQAFPLTMDVDIEASLADAFAEAQLDGFFGAVELNLDAMTVSPDLSTAGAALVVIYAGLRLVRQQIRSLRSMTKYVAGPVQMETAQAAGALTEDLKYLQARRLELLEKARRGAGATTFMIDSYFTRGRFSGTMFPYELEMSASWDGGFI
jgi:hypothetical protein